MRLLFTTDLHGSEKCWRKLLYLSGVLNVDCIIVGGDLTGKAIVPIIRLGDGLFKLHAFGKDYELRSEREVEIMEGRIRGAGLYPYMCTREEVIELERDRGKLIELFEELMKRTLRRWIDMASERLPKNVELILNPGNDDSFAIDDIIRQHERAIYPLNEVIQIGDRYEMISCEWVNPTPWNSPRECDEGELSGRLEREMDRLTHPEYSIFNFHAPPYGTMLDIAPKVGKDLKIVTLLGAPEMEHVGSVSVRRAIEERQPLLGLHGHIHESPGAYRLGRATCINPGSDYSSGILQYVFLIIRDGKVAYWRREI